MALYFLSDTHLGHRNLVEVFTVTRPDGVVHPARPFATVDEHDQAILQRYRDVVTEADTVWWLGDVCFKPTNAMVQAIAALPGTKHLILGNHDRETTTLYHQMGFVKLRSSWRPWKGVLITHIPAHPNSVPKGGVNVHGHTHSTCYDGPYVNVCVEQTDYRPLSEPDLRRRIEQATRHLSGGGLTPVFSTT
ncbi:MAG: hypothetical protein NUW22_05175 [Acidobacteria bacterium]|nr:hypothetical protein [Acidobacteriota bacterium]